METEYVEEEIKVPRDSAVDRTLERAIMFTLWCVVAMVLVAIVGRVVDAARKEGVTAGEWNVRKEAVELGYGRIEKGFFVWNQKN